MFYFGFISLLFFVVCSQPAHAYVDPNMGAYVLQMLVAFGMSVVFAVRRVREGIVQFFKCRFNGKDKT